MSQEGKDSENVKTLGLENNKQGANHQEQTVGLRDQNLGYLWEVEICYEDRCTCTFLCFKTLKSGKILTHQDGVCSAAVRDIVHVVDVRITICCNSVAG